MKLVFKTITTNTLVLEIKALNTFSKVEVVQRGYQCLGLPTFKYNYIKLMSSSMTDWSVCLLLFAITSMITEQMRSMLFGLKAALAVGYVNREATAALSKNSKENPFGF